MPYLISMAAHYGLVPPSVTAGVDVSRSFTCISLDAQSSFVACACIRFLLPDAQAVTSKARRFLERF